MFAEQALTEAEAAREFTLFDEEAVEPVEGAGAILNAVTSGRIVSHDFGSAVVSGGIDLGKNDASIGVGLKAVGFDELVELVGREAKAIGEETEERSLFGLRCESGTDYEFGGNSGIGSRLIFRRRRNGGDGRRSNTETAEVVEILARGVMVATGFSAFATAYFFVDKVTGEGVDVADKTMDGSTGGTSEAGVHAVVRLEFVTIGIHGSGVLEAFVLG